jgi:hypothetical protein
MRSHTYTDDLERQGDLQPGMSRHHQSWNAENGVREPAADLSRMAEDVRNRLIDRVEATAAGDRATARTMLEAVQVIKVLHEEIERLRKERDELAARCGDHGPGARTAGPVETFIPEAL